MQGFPLPGFGAASLLRPSAVACLVSPGSPGHSVRARLGLAGSLFRADAVGGGPFFLSGSAGWVSGSSMASWGPAAKAEGCLHPDCQRLALPGRCLGPVAASGGAFWSCRLGQDHAQLASMILAGSLALPVIGRGRSSCLALPDG